MDDLARCDDAALRQQQVSAVAQLALASLRSLRGVSVTATLAAVTGWLEQLAEAVRPAGPAAEESVMSTAKRIHPRGKADLLRRQLDARFGRLPIAVVARVHAASPADLDRWALAVLTAEDLDAVIAAR